MDLLPHLLPLSASLHVELLTVDAASGHVTVELHATASHSPCPLCAIPSRRTHSHYLRTVADLPWADLSVCLQLHVRKFFCDNPACKRKIFTERLPELVAPSARRSLRLTHQQQQLGLALGGNAATRLACSLDRPGSRNTFLRLVRRLPLISPSAPEIIGVDDWAWRKGQRYGTIILDLQRHRPIAMLPDRDASSLANWLRNYPSIRSIARDRAGIYAEAATKGAPNAIQVADRFHLVGNLSETLLAVFEHRSKELGRLCTSHSVKTVPPAALEQFGSVATAELVRTIPLAPPSPRHQAQAEQRRAARLARYEQARALQEQGWSLRAIGRELGLNRNTVRKYVRAESFPERAPRVVRQSGVLDPYIPYLIERWNAGCRTGTVLWQEICERGYRGKRVTVFSFVTRLRKALGIPAKKRTIKDGKVALPEERPLTARDAVWLVLKREEQRDEADTNGSPNCASCMRSWDWRSG